MLNIAELWDCRDEQAWEVALAGYWKLIKPKNATLEAEMNQLHENVKRFEDLPDWYSFLLNKYLPWKFTVPRSLAGNSRAFQKAYERDRQELEAKVRTLFLLDREDIETCLSFASKIKGLGVAALSGLLSLLFPTQFGTVDQMVVRALLEVGTLPERDKLIRMNPEKSLTVPDGVILVGIMRRKAAELNGLFRSSSWTPRKIDMVLWAKGHER